MPRHDKPSPAELRMLLEMVPKREPEILTALGGLALLVRAFGSLGLPGSFERYLRLKQRQRGL
ncbi:MAG: hypothetical protein ACRD2G_09920 [Terriglobia bacterium]